MNQNYRVTGEYIFRGIEYLVTIQTLNNGTTLCIEVEDKVTADQWRGTFEASCNSCFSFFASCCNNYKIVFNFLKIRFQYKTDI